MIETRPPEKIDELPFTAGIITVTLSAEQRDQLEPLVRRQVVDRRGLLFCSVAPFWHVEEGETKLRLQTAFLDHKTASKVLKLVCDARGGENRTGTMSINRETLYTESQCVLHWYRDSCEKWLICKRLLLTFGSNIG